MSTLNTIYIKYNLTTNLVKDSNGNRLDARRIILTNKDTVRFAMQFVQTIGGVETAVNSSNLANMRLVAKGEVKASSPVVFFQDTYNEGSLPAEEDPTLGKFVHLVNLNTAELDTHLGNESNKTVYIEYSAVTDDVNAYPTTLTPGGIAITISQQIGSGEEGDPEPASPTYLTAAEVLALLPGAALATTAALTALPQANLKNNQIKFIVSNLKVYYYDSAAVSGDLPPDDQVGGVGWWKIFTVNFTDAEKAKLSHITVTQAVDLDAMEDKLEDIEEGATADQTDEEIETAYNNRVAAGTSAEIVAGTEVAIRRFSPAQIKAAIDTLIAALVDSSPATLDTLNELAAALGDDPSFATTITTLIGTKLAIASNLSDVNNPVTARKNISTLASTVTPTGTTQTIDWNNGESAILDLNSATGTVTLTFSNPKAGMWYTLKVIQGATPRAIILPSTVKNGVDTPPITLTITAVDDATDLLQFFYDGTSYTMSYMQNTGG